MPTDPPTPQTESDLDFGPTLRGLRAGMKVFGRYELKGELGRGGMGVVWLAEDVRLDLEVALKFLPEHLAHDETAVDDLRRETQRCMKLSHTHIVRVHDLVEEGGAAAIVMEYVKGKTLAKLRLEKAGRVFEVGEVREWVRQVVEALGYAHEEGRMVHRDLKPSNVMVTERGQVKVMDFGIASSLGDSASRVSKAAVVVQGTSGGALPYMSPQQLLGYPANVGDDVYGLGAMIYELLTGKPPFYSGSIERQIESVVPVRMGQRREELGVKGGGEIPEAWERTIAGCLEKEAEKRPRSVKEVWEGLRGEKVVQAGREKGTEREASAGAGRKGALAVVALVGVLVVAGLGWWRWGAKGVDEVGQREIVEEVAAPTVEAVPVEGTLEVGSAPAGAVVEVEREGAEPMKGVTPMTVELSPGEVKVGLRLAGYVPASLSGRVKAGEVLKLSETLEREGSVLDQGTVGEAIELKLPGNAQLKLCYCPPGSFTMGSPAIEEHRSESENQVQVKISQGFWMGQTEVTQEQWAAVMGTTPEQQKAKGYSYGEVNGLGIYQPMYFVSWEEAQAFIRKLNQSVALPSGWKYALPSEAQWEYACRAGTESVFHFGEVLNGTQANCNGIYPYGTLQLGPYLGKTCGVGSYQANEWGLYDMHGNVLEWCDNLWDGSEKLAGGSDPLGTVGSIRVFRGGSWSDNGFFCRSANRAGYAPDIRSDDVGFRVAAVPAVAR